MLLETKRGTRYISPDAFQALARFGRDILVVGEGMPRSRVRRIFDCAAYAFTEQGRGREAAFAQLVAAIDELLQYRFFRTATRGEVEQRRLQAFVEENGDLHERLHEKLAS